MRSRLQTVPDGTSAVNLRVGGGLGMKGGSGLGCAVRTGNCHVVVAEDEAPMAKRGRSIARLPRKAA